MTILKPPAFEADYIDLRSLLRSLNENRRFIICTSLVVCLFALIYSFFTPTTYQASALLQIQPKKHRSLGSLPNPNNVTERETTSEPMSVQTALIRSKFVLEPVIHDLGLDITVSPASIFHWGSHPNKNIQISELQLPAKYLNRKLYLSVGENNQYRLYDHHHRLLLTANPGQLVHGKHDITIKINSIHATAGTQFVIVKKPLTMIINKLLAHLTLLDLSNSEEPNTNKVGILQMSFTGNNPDLITKIINQIALVTQEKSIERKSLQAEKQLVFLKKQLPTVKQSLQTTETTLNQYRSTTQHADIQLQTHNLMSHITDIDRQLQELRRKKSTLLQEYTSEYPFVRSINKKITSLEKSRSEQYRQLKKLPANDQTADAIKRDIKVKYSLYMALLNQIHELEMAKAGIISDVHILVLATTPDMPVPLKLSMIVVASLFAGLLLGCMIILMLQILSRRIDDPHWTEKTWGIRNLCVVPYSVIQARYTETKKPVLLAQQFPDDPSLNSLYSLRTWLQLNLSHSHNNIITFVGLTHGIGKSFISANLATLLARIGQKILLIDADVRTGHLHTWFAKSPTPGLTDVLNGRCALENALIKSSADEHLHFLPAGTHSNKIADLFTGQRLQTLISELSQQYQCVLINATTLDSPADYAFIGTLASMNLLVMGSHVHNPDDAHAALKQLAHMNITIQGTVFNHLKPARKPMKKIMNKTTPEWLRSL